MAVDIPPQVNRNLIRGFQVAVPGEADTPGLPILLVCEHPNTPAQVVEIARNATINGRVVTDKAEIEKAIELVSASDGGLSREFRRDFYGYLREGRLVCAIVAE